MADRDRNKSSEDQQDRLADALRDNLKRRKVQARLRRDQDPDDSVTGTTDRTVVTTADPTSTPDRAPDDD